MKSSAVTKCDHLHVIIYIRKLVFWIIRLPHHINLRKQDYGKKWDRFLLRLHYTVIFISNVQMPASVGSKLIVDLNSNCHDCSVQKNREKLNGFWQADKVECLIDERKLLMMKLDYIWSHLSTAFNSKKLFIALPQGMASTINNFAT